MITCLTCGRALTPGGPVCCPKPPTEPPTTDHLDRAAEVVAAQMYGMTTSGMCRGIARALEEAGLLVTPERLRARDAEVRAAERKKVLAGFTEVYALAWDGEPSMGGEPHRVSTGAELSEPDARRALATVGRRKPNARIERRLVGPWEPVEEDA